MASAIIANMVPFMSSSDNDNCMLHTFVNDRKAFIELYGSVDLRNAPHFDEVIGQVDYDAILAELLVLHQENLINVFVDVQHEPKDFQTILFNMFVSNNLLYDNTEENSSAQLIHVRRCLEEQLCRKLSLIEANFQ